MNKGGTQTVFLLYCFMSLLTLDIILMTVANYNSVAICNKSSISGQVQKVL